MSVQRKWVNGDEDRLLFGGLSWGLASRTLGLIFSLLTAALAVRGMGAGPYGVVAALTAFTSILGFADFGVGSAVTRRLSVVQLSDARMRDEARSVVSAALVMLGAIAVVLATILIALSWILPWDLILGAEGTSQAEVRAVLFAFSVSVAAGVVCTLGQRVSLGLRLGGSVARWTIIAGATSLSAVAACWLSNASSWLYVTALVGTPNMCLGFQTFVVLRRLGLVRLTRVRVHEQYVGILGAGSPFLLLNVSVAVGYSADASVVSAVLGSSSAATYALASKLCSAVGATLSASLYQLWPSLGLALAEGRVDWARRRFLMIGGSGLLAGALGLALVLACGPWFASTLFGANVSPLQACCGGWLFGHFTI